MEIFQEFGNDLIVSANGDLKKVDKVELTNQRIIRRLLTNPGDYIWHPEYGAGLPRYVGRVATPDLLREIKGLITSQMYLEEAVSQNPPPEITLNMLPNFLEGEIYYVNKFVNKQVVVRFST